MPADSVEAAIKTLLASFSPTKRRQLMRSIANELKRVNKLRMAQETAPDGTPWTERKGPPRGGRPKKMMAGLRRKMTAEVSPDKAMIGFRGNAGRIARIHHEGRTASVSPGGPRIRYAARELIGIAEGDLELIERIILEGR